jgi:hypothetical protein
LHAPQKREFAMFALNATLGRAELKLRPYGPGGSVE